MVKRAISQIACFLIMIGLIATVGHSDEWALPKKRKYFSGNKAFYVEITPKRLESQLKYFQDKVEGKENAGAKDIQRENRCKGSFYQRETSGIYRRLHTFNIVNEVAPVEVLVSNDGNFFVTFDNWHEAGYGPNVIVIYRSDGTLIRQLSLEDVFTKGDIESLPHSVSSIWWGGDHYIDERRDTLVLKVVAGRTAEGKEKYLDRRLRLSSGELLDAKTDLFPQPRVAIVPADATMIEKVSGKAFSESCSMGKDLDLQNATPGVTAELLEAAVGKQPLQYPPLAKAAKVQGTVVVRVLLDENGSVVCAEAIEGHPLLIPATLAQARNWSFPSRMLSGSPRRTSLIAAVRYEFR
jgi:TonB-like protein